jgi:hypothetical protein
MTIQQSEIGRNAYNTFSLLPQISYNCISYLLENNELVWKLLKYPTNDAWNKTNLTSAEKGALIYDGSPITGDSSDFRVFMDSGQPDAWTKEACILRICPYLARGKNRTVGTISILFEVFSHYKINTLSNYQTRVDTICQQLLETFNGLEIGGLGKAYFDVLGDQADKLSSAGAVPYKGKQIIMTTNVGGM